MREKKVLNKNASVCYILFKKKRNTQKWNKKNLKKMPNDFDLSNFRPQS